MKTTHPEPEKIPVWEALFMSNNGSFEDFLALSGTFWVAKLKDIPTPQKSKQTKKHRI